MSKQPPYVLKQDQEAVRRFNRGKPAAKKFNNDHPLPYRRMTQDPKLAIFEKILKEGCLDVLHRPYSAYLQSDYDKRSSGKWLKLLDPLIQQSGLQKVINHVGCINWWPYRIERLDEEGPALPSHDFTRQLVRDLLENKRIFVIPEEKDIWFNRLPELKFNRNLHNLILPIYSPKIRKKHITSSAF